MDCLFNHVCVYVSLILFFMRHHEANARIQDRHLSFCVNLTCVITSQEYMILSHFICHSVVSQWEVVSPLNLNSNDTAGSGMAWDPDTQFYNLPFLLMDDVSWRQQLVSPVLGHCQFHVTSEQPASVWPDPGCRRYLGNQQTGGSSLSLPVALPFK